MKTSRFDGPFWGLLVVATILVGSLAMIGLAAAAQDAAHTDVAIVVVDDS